MSIHRRQLQKRLEVVADRLAREFPSVPRAEVEKGIAKAVTPLLASARILDFVPILVERHVREPIDNGVLPHLHARDVTFLFVSQAPLEKLQAYKRRMGWSLPWVSTARTGFNFDLGFSHTEEHTREAVAPIAAALPPIAAHNASSTGTDLIGYLTEVFGFSTFVRDHGTVYHTYSTTGRGVEFLTGYYPILDHAPKGRDEGDAWQLWIHRHDEYGEAA